MRSTIPNFRVVPFLPWAQEVTGMVRCGSGHVAVSLFAWTVAVNFVHFCPGHIPLLLRRRSVGSGRSHVDHVLRNNRFFCRRRRPTLCYFLLRSVRGMLAKTTNGTWRRHFKRKSSGLKWSSMEKKLLAQASIIALYDIGSNLPWSFLVFF